MLPLTENPRNNKIVSRVFRTNNGPPKINVSQNAKSFGPGRGVPPPLPRLSLGPPEFGIPAGPLPAIKCAYGLNPAVAIKYNKKKIRNTNTALTVSNLKLAPSSILIIAKLKL